MVSPDNPIQFNTRKDTIPSVDKASDVKRRNEPNARRNFKEVVDENKNNPDESDLALKRKSDEDEDQSSPMSLFTKQKPHPRIVKNDLRDVEDQKMLFEEGAVLAPINTKESDLKIKPSIKPKEKMSDSKEEVLTQNSEIESLSKKGKFNSQYAEGQPDIASISQMAVPNDKIEIQSVNYQKVEQTTSIASPIHDVVNELIDKLMIVETKGQSDIVVTLNHPGVFKGTILVVSEFDHAKGELNISFENLTQQSKNLLDNPQNRENLMTLLSEKGYVVQQMVTTTLTEHQPIIAAQSEGKSNPSKEEKEDNRGFNQQKRQKE